MNKKQSNNTKFRGRKKDSERNFGLGTRSLLRAGRVCAHQSTLAFSTRGTLAARWAVFEQWVTATHGITKMETLTPQHVTEYGEHLNTRVEQLELRASTAQLYVSAVNSIMRLATEGSWKSISPTRDCNIPRRKHLPEISKALLEHEHDHLMTVVDARVRALLNLQRFLGLRFKESCLLNARQALRQARKKGIVIVSDGTKGGKIRQVPTNEDAIGALAQASELQSNSRSMIPENISYVDFREECYQVAKMHKFNFHSERHFYAQRRYRELSGLPAPVTTTVSRKNWPSFAADYLKVDLTRAEAIDRAARLALSRELGHERLEVTRVYIG